MLRFSCTRDEAREILIGSYLDPDELWFLDFVDRRERTLFTTAARHHLAIDEPARPIEPALERLLQRWEANDPELVVVPRMPNVERERHMDDFLSSLEGTSAHAPFDERQRAMRGDWDRHWRPGSFETLARDLPGDTYERWLARLHASAAPVIDRFCVDNAIDLSGMERLVFE